VLEANRDRDRDTGQVFYSGLKRVRELQHDVQIHRAYEREAAGLEKRGLEIERARLDYDLKREYQQWLHECDRNRPDADGRPDRLHDPTPSNTTQIRPTVNCCARVALA